MASTAVVMTHTRRGRTAIASPIFAHTPVSVVSAEPNAGRRGQNTHRPTITSSAGSSVTITRNVIPTPIAVTGPSPAVEFISANVRHSSPATTVAALARIAGAA